MPELEVLTTADKDRWLAVLSSVERFDFYDLPQYHELAERTGGGRGRLLVYQHQGGTIALPLMFRSCAAIEGLEGETSWDAGSVYGYAGPLSTSPPPSATDIADFQSTVRTLLDSLGVVALFSSLNPLIPQTHLIAGLGEIAANGTTVSIDLTLSPEEQLAQYRLNHRRGIRRLRALGAACDIDDTRDLGEFVDIYHETMSRVGAASQYFFDHEYFALLQDLLGSQVKLFRCTLGDEAIAAGLFLVCGDIVQYHLGATRTAYVELGPMKLIIDTVRQWATETGMRVLHLGGGVGAQEDSLFHFKAGFSDRRHQYATWRWVPNPQAYARISARKAVWNSNHGLEFPSTDHFPLYRSRVAPIQAPGEPLTKPTVKVKTSRQPDSEPTFRNVLVTAAGRRTSLVIAFADEVRRRGGRMFAGDVDPLAPALFLANEAIQLRATTDPDYVTGLMETVKRYEIGLLVPTIDPDLPVLARSRAALKSIGCVTAVSDESFIEIVSDKLATESTFGTQGIAVPKSWAPDHQRTALPDLVFVKPRRGSASQGAGVATRRDLTTTLSHTDDPIIQEVLSGPEITIDALLDLDGRPIHYVPRYRLRTLAGESIQGVTLEHDRDVERWIENLLEICGSLGAAGPLCLQAFLTERGPVLSEVNARFGGGFPLGRAAGGLYTTWLLDLIEGIPVPSRLGNYESGLYMTRYYSEYFTRSPRW